MRQSKVGYYADFVAYPLAALVMAAFALRSPELRQQIDWLIACVAGFAVWSLAEYLIHRFVFHRMPLIARMHEMHHDHPSALIGAPVWVSGCAFGFGAFFPLWSVLGFKLASGLVTGLMLGYLYYVLVHTAIHRWQLDRNSFFYQAKLHHIRHHFGAQEGNFGVTTRIWDYFFGTIIDS
ncbi:MAG TPA: sterol desaturase family protein [Xanthobacteraceae bacterium]|nr:sterol desaturase family protein [Xanthobacteraceae bacterium]